MLTPGNTGIFIVKTGYYIVVCRFVLVVSAGGRIGYGVREYRSASDYSDSVDSYISVSNLSNTYTYIRAGRFTANAYLRPIVSSAGGGTCTGCNLSVISLKAT